METKRLEQRKFGTYSPLISFLQCFRSWPCCDLAMPMTALYAYKENGASTDYLKQLGLEVIFTPTGVKHLHEKAAQFDIGIYFEANGHGTILFSESWLSLLETKNNELRLASEGSEQQKAALSLLSVKVVDRTAVVTTNAETVAVSPPGIQEAIDTETAKYLKCRCFIRPSGTEDVVRIYAEASTQEAADSLADSVAKLVDRFLGLQL